MGPPLKSHTSPNGLQQLRWPRERGICASAVRRNAFQDLSHIASSRLLLVMASTISQKYDLAHFPLVPYKARSERSKHKRITCSEGLYPAISTTRHSGQNPGGKKKSSKTDTTSQALKLKREVYSREIPHGLTHKIKSLLLFSPLETRSNGLSCWVFNLLQIQRNKIEGRGVFHQNACLPETSGCDLIWKQGLCRYYQL